MSTAGNNGKTSGKNGRRVSEFGTVAGLDVNMKNRRPSVLDVRAKREARKALNSFVEGCVSILILLALEAIHATELYILSLSFPVDDHALPLFDFYCFWLSR